MTDIGLYAEFNVDRPWQATLEVGSTVATTSECFVGESLRVALNDVRDINGDFVTSLGGGESMSYVVEDENDNMISSGSLSYVADTNATWRVFPTMPSSPCRVEIRVTGTIDSATRKWIHRVKVKALT